MAKYQQYSEYKDSGVEWLGRIPSSWQVKKLKYLSKVTTGSKDTVNAVEDGKYPFFVRSQTVERINSIGADCEAVLTAGDGVGVGKVYHYYKGKFDFHQRVYMLYDFGAVTGRFVYYYLSSNFYKVALEGNAKSTVDSLRLPQFLNFEFSVPTVAEQNYIVDFLNYETAKIDSLIEKQQKLIELLKEKRQAVISHAVTKGLNPDVPMKDSGVEWLGEIPSHWGTVFLKMVIDVRDGTHETPAYVEPTINSYPLVTSKDVTGGWVDLSECKHISESDYRSIIKRSNVAKGDILMPMIGTVGSPVIVKDELEIAIKNLALFRTSDENLKIYNKFLYYFLNSEECNIQFILEGRGGVQNFVSLGTLRNLRLPYLSLNEQTEIADFLDYETTKIDHLINKVKQQIQLMQERGTVLISAAVTGKIDVRNWQNPTEAKMEFSE